MRNERVGGGWLDNREKKIKSGTCGGVRMKDIEKSLGRWCLRNEKFVYALRGS